MAKFRVFDGRQSEVVEADRIRFEGSFAILENYDHGEYKLVSAMCSPSAPLVIKAVET